MISIDEQIANLRGKRTHGDKPLEAAIASLERLKKIESVQVPEEPKCLEQYVRYYTKVSSGGVVQLSSTTLLKVLTYIDTLRDLLRRESAECQRQTLESFRLAKAHEAAEATVAAMLKLGENPSEEIRNCISTINTTTENFRAMFAKLVEQAGVKK